MLKDLEDALSVRWPKAELRPFGSFPAYLSIFLSDLDVTVYGLGVDGSADDKVPPISAPTSPEPDTPTETEASQRSKRKLEEDDAFTAAEELRAGNEYEEVGWSIDLIGSSTLDQQQEHEKVMEGESARKKQRREYDRDDPTSCYSISSDSDVSDDECSSSLQQDGQVDIHISTSTTGSHGSSDGLPAFMTRPKGRASFGVMETPAEKALKKKTLGLLYSFSSFVRTLDWAEEMEVRARARVPIINLVHRGGVECDISLGISGSSTSVLVERARNIPGYKDAFFTVSAFLKCFLHMLVLDKPFTGGLGSYKLYVMIAYVIVKVVQPTVARANAKAGADMDGVPATPDSGFLLLAFLRYFGQPANLNEYTVLEVLGATADFKGAQLVRDCQQVFQKAYGVLRKARDEGVGSVHAMYFNGRKDYSNHSVRPPLAPSLLSLLLYKMESFMLKRAYYSKQCRELCPLLNDQDKDRMGTSVLVALQRKLKSALEGSVTPQDVKRVNPLLWERLRCFASVSDAVPHPMGRVSDLKSCKSIGSSNKKNKRQKSKGDERKQAAKHRLKGQYEDEEFSGGGKGGNAKKRKRDTIATRTRRGGAPSRNVRK